MHAARPWRLGTNRKDELEGIDGSTACTVRTLGERLEMLSDDPWVGYAPTQRITRAVMQRLDSK